MHFICIFPESIEYCGVCVCVERASERERGGGRKNINKCRSGNSLDFKLAEVIVLKSDLVPQLMSLRSIFTTRE